MSSVDASITFLYKLVLSDSMIGINKFYAPLPQSGFLIMITYIGGQFLIITGLLTHFQKTRPVSTAVA